MFCVQIKNSVSVAQSFASGSGKELTIQHIYTVLDMMRDWEKAKKDYELSLRTGSVGLGIGGCKIDVGDEIVTDSQFQFTP